MERCVIGVDVGTASVRAGVFSPTGVLRGAGRAPIEIWRDGAREYFDDNPLLLTNRKAKKLASLLRKQLTVQKRRTPYIQSLVFLSDPAQRCKLTGPARENVHLRADIANKLFDETAPVASASAPSGDPWPGRASGSPTVVRWNWPAS